MTTEEVETNAGNIFILLSSNKNLSIREIGDYTNCKDRAIFLALGWLLKENKIICFEKNGSLSIESKSGCLTEIYY